MGKKLTEEEKQARTQEKERNAEKKRVAQAARKVAEALEAPLKGKPRFAGKQFSCQVTGQKGTSRTQLVVPKGDGKNIMVGTFSCLPVAIEHLKSTLTPSSAEFQAVFDATIAYYNQQQIRIPAPSELTDETYVMWASLPQCQTWEQYKDEQTNAKAAKAAKKAAKQVLSDTAPGAIAKPKKSAKQAAKVKGGTAAVLRANGKIRNELDIKAQIKVREKLASSPDYKVIYDAEHGLVEYISGGEPNPLLPKFTGDVLVSAPKTLVFAQ